MNLWNNKNIFDLWTVLHFCFGVLITAISYLFNIKPAATFFIVVALAIAWEIFERISGIKESYLNSLSDILIAIVAFIVVFYLMKYFQNYSYLAHILTVFCILVYAIFFIFKKIG